MNRPLKLLVATMGWLAIALISSVAFAALDTPAILITETGFNFGEFSETTPVSHDFVVKNGGKATLNISDVKPS